MIQCDLDEVRTNDQHGDEVATVKSDAYYCHLILDFDSWLWVVTGGESRLLSNSYVFHSRFFIRSVPIHCFHSFSFFCLLPFIYFSVYGVSYVIASLLSMEDAVMSMAHTDADWRDQGRLPGRGNI